MKSCAMKWLTAVVLVAGVKMGWGQPQDPPPADQEQPPGAERRQNDDRRDGQRGGRFRGRGFSSSAMLVTLAMNDEVAKALELSDEQKKYLAMLRDQIREEDREFFSSLGDDLSREERFEKMREYQAKRGPEVDTHMKEVLGEAKLTRLKEIRMQTLGPMALMSPEVQKDVEMTDSQREQMQTAMREVFGSIRDQFRGRRGGDDGDQDSRRQAMEEMRKQMEDKLMGILTDKQKERWAKMVGEPAGIDLDAVRRSIMPGPPRGRERGNRGGSETERPQT